MTIQTTLAYDAISANVGSLPKGSQVAGYSTGSGIVPWTAAQWAAHPGAVRIDQDPAASDATADVLDVEAGAATVGDCPGWVARARAARAKNTRTGQREPAIYVNRSNITAVANALTGAHVTGVGLWVADWDLTEQEAQAEVTSASGPFPVIGVQYNSGTTYDTSVFSVPWLHAVSGAAPPHKKVWKEWNTAGELSLAQFAAKLDVGPATLLANTVKHYGYFNAPLGAYIKAVFEGTSKPTDSMPKGCKLWVLA